MKVQQLIKETRSICRFHAQKAISTEKLYKMVDSARCSASAGNLQRIRYILINDEKKSAEIFETLAFAAYLKGWRPSVEERPAAYIVMLSPTEKIDTGFAVDMGIAAQSILLTAKEEGIGGCIVMSFKKQAIERILCVDGYNVAMVIALGEPSETVRLTQANAGEIKYYRNEQDEHIVPKLSLDEIIL